MNHDRPWGAPLIVRAGLVAVVWFGLAGCSGGGGGAEPTDAGAAIDQDAGPTTDAGGGADVWCEAPEPPADALRKAGPQDDGTFLIPGGRALDPAGVQVVTEGFPVRALVHPTLPVAYVANAGFEDDDRNVEVIDLSTGVVLEEHERQDLYTGLALSPDGQTLFVTGGHSGQLERFAVGADGRLDALPPVFIGGYPAGVVVSGDGTRVWVAQFIRDGDDEPGGLVEVDTGTLEAVRTLDLPSGAFDLVHLPGRAELYVTFFAGSEVGVVELDTWALAHQYVVGENAHSLVVSDDESRVYVSVADIDTVAALDTAAREVVGTALLGEDDLVAADGTPLPATSPSGMALRLPPGDGPAQLLVARAADNAVQVLDAATLAPLGLVPTQWYPTAVALGGGKLVVTNGKGVGAGPTKQGDGPAKDNMTGTVSVIDEGVLDTELPELTERAERAMRRPGAVWQWDCAGTFPVPTTRGRPTPIEHVVLIVRENKTYDSLLGDWPKGDGDPSLVEWGADITPNLHALADRFASHDNFYDDSESSVQGHLWLTSSFVNDYMERGWMEMYRGHGNFALDSGTSRGRPAFGSIFTHLLEHDVPFRNYGEVVGAFDSTDAGDVIEHVDTGFPGVFYNMDVHDVDKAAYVIEQLIDKGDFPRFVYLLLPNDHTKGGSKGAPTPRSMVHDNDVATGMVVDAISHSKFWEKTAIFILQDDTQSAVDHVDAHRSVLVVASPWAKRGHVSGVHASYPAVFATIEHILDVPPMNRHDGSAAPLWDIWTTQPDLEPFVFTPRQFDEEFNTAATPGSGWSDDMDFRGPDRNPLLGDLLWWIRKGALPAGSPLRGLDPSQPLPAHLRGWTPEYGEGFEADESGEAPDEEYWEHDAFDAAWRQLDAYLAIHPERHADLRRRPDKPRWMRRIIERTGPPTERIPVAP